MLEAAPLPAVDLLLKSPGPQASDRRGPSQFSVSRKRKSYPSLLKYRVNLGILLVEMRYFRALRRELPDFRGDFAACSGQSHRVAGRYGMGNPVPRGIGPRPLLPTGRGHFSTLRRLPARHPGALIVLRRPATLPLSCHCLTRRHQSRLLPRPRVPARRLGRAVSRPDGAAIFLRPSYRDCH